MSLAPRPASSRSLASLAVALVCSVVLAACGGVEGRYSTEETMPDGSKAKFTLELKGGDKAVMTMGGGALGSASMTAEGTYSVDGDKVSVVIDGDTEVFTRKGGALVGKMLGDDIELSKE